MLKSHSLFEGGVRVKEWNLIIFRFLNEPGDHMTLLPRVMSVLLRISDHIHNVGQRLHQETSPTARIESWCIVFYIVAFLGWDAQQVDV